jgi:DNA-binding transcriptional LysR family regulator
MPRHFGPVTLRLFVAVCEERNIARAAEREAIAASAVSKRVGAMEKAIGSPLLPRGRCGIEPTAAGEVPLRQARDMLGVTERMQAQLSEFGTGVHGSVRVAASVSVLAERLPDNIARFLARHHDVRVSLGKRVSQDLLRHVRECTADLGVLWDVTDLGGLHTVAYRSDQLCVAVNASHPLVRKRRVSFRDTLRHASIGVTPGGTMEPVSRRQAALEAHTLNTRNPGVEPGRSLSHRRGRAGAVHPSRRGDRTARPRFGADIAATGRAMGTAPLCHLLATGRPAVGNDPTADRSPAATGSRDRRNRACLNLRRFDMRAA